MNSINKINWDRLRMIEKELREYVHGGCNIYGLPDPSITWYDCPDDHGHKVDLAHSFAWTLADRLRNILTTESEIEMEEMLKETLMMYATFKRQKHNHPELFQLAKEIYRACHQKEKNSG